MKQKLFERISTILRDPKTKPEIRSVAASALTQRDKPRERTVTRLEVIKPGVGRMLVLYDVSVELSYQDDDRTLKVFVRKPDEPTFAETSRICPRCQNDWLYAPHTGKCYSCGRGIG